MKIPSFFDSECMSALAKAYAFLPGMGRRNLNTTIERMVEERAAIRIAESQDEENRFNAKSFENGDLVRLAADVLGIVDKNLDNPCTQEQSLYPHSVLVHLLFQKATWLLRGTLEKVVESPDTAEEIHDFYHEARANYMRNLSCYYNLFGIYAHDGMTLSIIENYPSSQIALGFGNCFQILTDMSISYQDENEMEELFLPALRALLIESASCK